MDAWHDFFLAQAGAAGVLTGLLFVGVSINLEKILADPNSGLPGRAAEGLLLLVAVLIMSTSMLVPGQGVGLVGGEVLGLGLGTWIWVSGIQFLRLKDWATIGHELRMSLILRVLLGQAALLTLLAAGIILLLGGAAGLYVLAMGTNLAILVALFGAWVLLIEINR